MVVSELRYLSNMILTPKQLGLSQWRPGQYQAIQNSRNSARRFVGQCAPTGTGKSHILMGEALESGARTLILTATKPLQKQYIETFAHLNILGVKGKANYTCNAMLVGGEFYDGSPARSVAEAPCQFGEECGLRISGCTYYDAVSAAKYYRRVCTNYAAYISANLYTEGWGKFNLVICDEAHEADMWLSKMLAVQFPRCYTNLTGAKLPNSTNIPTWVAWAKRELPMIKAAIRLEKRALAKARRKKYARLRTLQSLDSNLERMVNMTHEWRVFPGQSHILFQPIWVHEHAEPLLFNGADKVVCASSTMVPNTLNLLGIPDSEMDFFSYPSQFPVSRRPIYYHPVARMRHGMPETEIRECVDVIDSFIAMRLDRKGFIPTPSFALQNLIMKHSRFSSLMVASSQSSTAQTGSNMSLANMTLQRFKASPQPSILIGPSWNTGINLPYKLAEYTVVPKMFMPDITDPLLVARTEDHPDYAWSHAGMVFTQAIGRAMRAEDDLNEVLVTDATFGRFMSQYRRMIADWVWPAVQYVNVLPNPLQGLI